jgi:hypothetical protein
MSKVKIREGKGKMEDRKTGQKGKGKMEERKTGKKGKCKMCQDITLSYLGSERGGVMS